MELLATVFDKNPFISVCSADLTVFSEFAVGSLLGPEEDTVKEALRAGPGQSRCAWRCVRLCCGSW